MGNCNGNYVTSSGGGNGLPEAISSQMTINGKTFVINGDQVTSPSGNTFTVREISEPDKEGMKFAKKMGFEDPVKVSSRALTERSVAQRALEQKKQERENFNENMRKNVPGYDEIVKARAHNNSERQKFNKSFDSEGGIHSPKYQDVAVLEKKYPRATAYLKAEGYSSASNYVKARLGKEAMDAIRMGKPYKKAIKDMEKKWHDHTNEAVWRN